MSNIAPGSAPVESGPIADRKHAALRMWRILGLSLFVLLVVGLRVIALDADAYPRLSWSSALLTDEGFYVHNARNLVLFGTQRTDDFNNALIMPTLHFVQIGVFRLFGVGAIQARSISVVCSLLTLLLFWSALCRAFGARTAWLGTLFLGLDHVNLLYNRLALMDTPAALGMVAAFWAFVRATQTPPSSHVIGERNPHAIEERTRECAGEGKSSATKVGWLGLCGVLLVVAYATRGLSALLLPVPFVALWGSGRARSERVWLGKSCLALGVGIMVTLGLYLGSWYLPHRAELQRVNRYYLFNQLVPRNARELGKNVTAAFVNVPRGQFPYLVKHSPVPFGLAVFFGAWWLRTGRKRTEEAASPAIWFLLLWLFLAVSIFCLIDYAPSRYYVLYYPAMSALGAIGWGGLTPGFALFREKWQTSQVLAFGLMLLWGSINLGWTADWLTHLTYRQKAADRWLAENLPENSVLLGAVAPGLCLNNRFRVVNLIEKLCNDDHPVERFAPSPRYIVMIDNRNWTERWWVTHYPEIVRPENRVHIFPGLLRSFFLVSVYRVP